MTTPRSGRTGRVVATITLIMVVFMAGSAAGFLYTVGSETARANLSVLCGWGHITDETIWGWCPGYVDGNPDMVVVMSVVLLVAAAGGACAYRRAYGAWPWVRKEWESRA